MLKHTFEDPGLKKASTNNLMDYNQAGTELWHSQWQYMRNPDIIFRPFEGDEQGAYESYDFPKGTIASIIRRIKNANESSEEKFSLKDFKNILISYDKVIGGGEEILINNKKIIIKMAYFKSNNSNAIRFASSSFADKLELKNDYLYKFNDMIIDNYLSNTYKQNKPCLYIYVPKVDAELFEEYIGFKKVNVTKVNNTQYTATVQLSADILKDIFPGINNDRAKEIANIINKYSDQFEINTPLRMAHFLGQVGHETQAFKGSGFKEGTCYTENGKWNIWFNLTWKEPPYNKTACNDVNPGQKKNYWNKIADVPKKYRCDGGEVDSKTAGKNLFSYVYRCEGGNGNELSEDGYKYRGHGFIHLTWKRQYIEFDNWLNSQGLGRDYKKIMSNPDEAFEDMEIACLSGMWYWNKGRCNKTADETSPTSSFFEQKIEKISKKVNKAAENQKSRIKYFNDAYNILNK